VSYHPLPWNTAGRQIRRFPSRRSLIWAVVVAAFLVLFVRSRTTGWLVEWLWMRTLGYADVFLHLLSIRLLLFASAFAVSFVYLWSNLALAGRNIMARYGVDPPPSDRSRLW
jgi:uncharacterized membrane protein (UPF0182 family)